MTETTEQIIANLAKDRAKTILENGDFWSGPSAAKTSAEAVGTLLSYRWQLESPSKPADPDSLINEAVATAKELLIQTGEMPATIVKEKRTGKAKEQAAATAEANDTDAADV